MKQLTSPPISARAFARWVIENYRSAERPLASVQLLLSEPTPNDFVYSLGGQDHTVTPQRADFATARQAIRDWQALSTDLDDLMLFYFCGHGFGDPSNVALLMSDFGTVAAAPLEGTLDFTGFRLGMEDCMARQQCYFVDACRLGSELLERNRFAGDPVLHVTLQPNPGGLPRIGPQFFSTLVGEAAYGRAGKPSVFTEALIDALSGPGARDENGVDWVVKTGQLHTALEFLIKDASRTNGWAQEQRPIAEGMQDVELNTLPHEPIVPVVVSVEPNVAHQEAVLRYDDGNGGQDQRAADPMPWSLRLPFGTYSFHAEFASARFANVSIPNSLVTPPYQIRKLKVP